MIKKIDKKAFTLIEVLVVVAIIGILTLLALPRFMGQTQKAELVRIQHDVKAMEQEIGAKLINGDNEFNKWGSNSKDLNQLVQDKELFENEGIATEIDSTDDTYKVIPKEYKAKINTKLKGTFYANSGGKVYYEHGQGPGYSDEEIEDKIKQGFIPIATAEELNNVRRATLETYGKGTEWEDEYTGGLDKKYIQVKDVDLSVYSEGEGWNPIGNYSASFTGTYDGGNYVITDLEVKGDGKYYQGLFGYTDGATISNVGLIDNKVAGSGYVGGLVGRTKDGTKISNSYATGPVEGINEVGGLVGSAGATVISNSYASGSATGNRQVGGLVGWTRYNNTISNSYATGSVTATSSGQASNAGGLVGEASSGTTIKNSYATGPVKSAGTRVGGLVGQAQNNNTISNSYFTGSVTGKQYVGGLVGWIFNDSSYTKHNNKISNSYATGSVTGTGSYNVGGLAGVAEDTNISNSYATSSVTGANNVGGLVGMAYESFIENSYAVGPVKGTYQVGGLLGRATTDVTISNSYASGFLTGWGKGGLVGDVITSIAVTNSYWDTETTGKTTSAGGEGKTTEEMKLKNTYKDWDFDNVWEIDEGNDYPKLR